MSYRKDLDEISVYAEEEDIDKTEFITLSYARDILNNIESKVNEIRDILNRIKGLSEIDEVYELIDKLSNDLY